MADANRAETLDDVIARDWIARLDARLRAGKAALDALDAALGDGDHGSTMSRGGAQAVASLPAGHADVPAILRATGRAFLGIGGASGAVYGTFFTSLGRAFAGSHALDGPALATALAQARDAIAQRTGAQPGDKTLLDALDAAARAAQAAASQGLAFTAAAAARGAAEGAALTRTLLARHGRAKFVGAASVGHEDPGAVSMAWILEALAAAIDAARDEKAAHRA